VGPKTRGEGKKKKKTSEPPKTKIPHGGGRVARGHGLGYFGEQKKIAPRLGGGGGVRRSSKKEQVKGARQGGVPKGGARVHQKQTWGGGDYQVYFYFVPVQGHTLPVKAQKTPRFLHTSGRNGLFQKKTEFCRPKRAPAEWCREKGKDLKH